MPKKKKRRMVKWSTAMRCNIIQTLKSCFWKAIQSKGKDITWIGKKSRIQIHLNLTSVFENTYFYILHTYKKKFNRLEGSTEKQTTLYSTIRACWSQKIAVLLRNLLNHQQGHFIVKDKLNSKLILECEPWL